MGIHRGLSLSSLLPHGCVHRGDRRGLRDRRGHHHGRRGHHHDRRGHHHGRRGHHHGRRGHRHDHHGHHRGRHDRVHHGRRRCARV